MSRYEIVLSGRLPAHLVAELDAVTTLTHRPLGTAGANTVLHIDQASPDDLTRLLEALEHLGLGLSKVRALDEE